MARGYVVGIASETKAFRQGVETGVIDPLDDAQKALKDLGDSKGPDKLERSLEDAQDATERLKKETKETADAIDKEYRDAYRQMKQSSEDSFDGAKQGAEEFKEEANQSARETAASFEEADALDLVQELAANAFAGFGPAGAVAGLAAAAGIGLAVTAFDDANEASEEAQQAAADWAQAYIDAGSRILSASQVIEGVQAIVTDPQQFKDAKDNAREWGVSTSVALLAMAGDANALAEAQESLRAKDYEYRQQLDDDSISKASGDFAQFHNDIVNGKEAMDTLTAAQNLGGQQADAYSESLRLVAERTEGATKKTDEFGDTVYTLPDGKEIYIDAETGKATENVDAIERKVYGIPDKTVTLKADAAAFERELERIRRQDYSISVGVEYQRRGSWLP